MTDWGAPGVYRIRFNDADLPARAGQTVAAALIGSGQWAFRNHPVSGEPRGPFCGMGVCFECELTIDGTAGERSCLVETAPGMVIGTAPTPRLRPGAKFPDHVAEFDAVVVGAGPAGLSAALELGGNGARVALVDESPRAGGQYYKPAAAHLVRRNAPRQAAGERLIAAVQAAGVEWLPNTLVWGAQDQVLYTSDTRTGMMRALKGRCTILATGAYERCVPFPGWTLPGVCTPGCALHLAAADGVRVGATAIVAGTGPFLLAVACALLEVGTRVSAVLELNTPYRFRLSRLSALAQPARMLDLARYLATLRRHGVPLLQGWHVLGAQGSGALEQVFIGQVDGSLRRTLAADALCIGYGFKPSTELARLMGCVSVPGPGGDVVPLTRRDGRTSVPSVFVVGEGAAIGGAHAAAIGGQLAGDAASQDLGLKGASPRRRRRLEITRRRSARFTHLLAQLYPVPDQIYAHISDETIVCRCEHVSAGAVRQVLTHPWEAGMDEVKAETRAGMGPCQGRECAHTLDALVHPRPGVPIDTFTVRMPLKPIRIPPSDTIP